ncbi:MAG: ABC transporter ATP-binding protein [Polyangia bacterium]
MSEIVVRADKLGKTFRLGLFKKRVEAVHDVSFEVERGEILGLLGPNGAGKTTTIKMLMGLIFPSRGRAEIFGRPVPTIESKRDLGFLPESPYFYDYLTGAELLDLMGQLCGLDRSTRRRRAGELLERVGLGPAKDRPLRKYSKGMLQRIGLAQALLNDPKLVVLDEPMSGLDPIGRKEVRDLILELRTEGRTILFSTHILSDVELLCDRVAIIAQGRLRESGALDRILSPLLLHTEIVLEGDAGKELVELDPSADVNERLRLALAEGKRIVSVTPRKESLEDLFVRELGGSVERAS